MVLKTILNIILSFVAGTILIGIIAENDAIKQRNLTITFAVIALLIVCINTVI